MPKPYLKILPWFPKAPKIQFVVLSLVQKAIVSWLLLMSLSIICHHSSSCTCLDTLSSIFLLSFRTQLEGHLVKTILPET